MQARLNKTGSTLSLKPRAAISSAADEEKTSPAVAIPLVMPVFDPERLAVQTYSAEGGSGFIQGKNFFSSTGKFLREAPENLWYITTPVQEENNRKARARNRQIFGHKTVAAINAPALPAKLLQMARENARASAAETLAE